MGTSEGVTGSEHEYRFAEYEHEWNAEPEPDAESVAWALPTATRLDPKLKHPRPVRKSAGWQDNWSAIAPPAGLSTLAAFCYNESGGSLWALRYKTSIGFNAFAVSAVSGSESQVTWRELFERWRRENPSTDEYSENVAAIQESLDAMDAGRMRLFSAFDAEFRQHHGMTDG